VRLKPRLPQYLHELAKCQLFLQAFSEALASYDQLAGM